MTHEFPYTADGHDAAVEYLNEVAPELVEGREDEGHAHTLIYLANALKKKEADAA